MVGLSVTIREEERGFLLGPPPLGLPQRSDDWSATTNHPRAPEHVSSMV